MIRLAMLAGLILAAIQPPPAAATDGRPALRQQYRDLTLLAIEPGPNEKFDIRVVDARTGLKRLTEAIDLLHDRSPFSIAAIDRLRAAGEVILVYDPRFPKDNLSTLTIAAFFPDFYRHDGAAKQFVAVVGRYGAKWPPAELAAVLAHELVGHGMQHLRGQLAVVRTIDLECEAYLYEKRVYQDLALDKGSGEMIRFRQALEDQWCKPFRAHLKRHDGARMALWERLNPDVPGLLDAYLDYVDSLDRSGAAKRGIDAERQNGLRR